MLFRRGGYANLINTAIGHILFLSICPRRKECDRRYFSLRNSNTCSEIRDGPSQRVKALPTITFVLCLKASAGWVDEKFNGFELAATWQENNSLLPRSDEAESEIIHRERWDQKFKISGPHSAIGSAGLRKSYWPKNRNRNQVAISGKTIKLSCDAKQLIDQFAFIGTASKCIFFSFFVY